VVIGETGRVTCPTVKANNVIVAGLLKGNVITEKLEIRSTGRVWGDVVTTAFSTEEGAFLRGQVRMEETLEIDNVIDETVPAEPVKKEKPAKVKEGGEETKPSAKPKIKKIA
jgi:cytoskeletal protein CcmA (bactofilin family)